jgi:hypothetical protein
MPGKKTRRIQTRSRRGRRLVRKTRKLHRKRQTRHSHERKQRGGNIFLDANRTPAGATIAGPGNPDLEGGPGTMEEYSDYHNAFEDEEAGPSQGV